MNFGRMGAFADVWRSDSLARGYIRIVPFET